MPDALKLMSLPLFPLGTDLFPGGVLPLQIFEVRYLDMVGKAYKAGAPFGVVTLNQGQEVRRAEPSDGPSGATGAFAPEAFHAVGTLATITTLTKPQAGLLVIECLGTQRFTLTRKEQLRHGLWLGDVTCMAPDIAVAIPADLLPAGHALGQVIQSMQLQNPAGNLPIQGPYQLDDCSWVANRWCELLPIPPGLKQKLMSLDNPLVRLELVFDILQKTGIA